MLVEPQYFCKFDLIIASNIPQSHLMPLADLAWTGNIPLLVIRSYGLIGSIRLQLHHHEVYDSREERDMYDLRLAQPFPELVQFLESKTPLLHCVGSIGFTMGFQASI